MKYIVAHGIVGYGPDSGDAVQEWYTVNTRENVALLCECIQEELEYVIEREHDGARASADANDYRSAWEQKTHAEDIEIISRKFDPARANAPLYRKDFPLWRETVESMLAEHFPLTYAEGTRQLWVTYE